MSLLGACDAPAPPSLEGEEFGWVDFQWKDAGVTLRYPDRYQPEPHRGRVYFRYRGQTAFRMIWTDEREGRRKGLWFREKGTDDVVAGREGLRTVYDHYDGPFGQHLITYSVGHGGKVFGIEFRSDDDELDSVQHAILSSVRLFPTVATP